MKNSVKFGVILGVSLIISSVILGSFFYRSRMPQATINVVGMASAKFESDTVKWSITLEETTGVNEIKEGYKRLENTLEALRGILKSKGIKDKEINLKPINMRQDYDYEKHEIRGYVLYQSLFIISDRVDEVEALALNPKELLDEDIITQTSRLEYFYSGTDDLKKELISDATANARERAEKMLENTDMVVGKLISVKAGVFQITEPYSTEVSSYGIYDTSSRNKQITVTAHTVFKIK